MRISFSTLATSLITALLLPLAAQAADLRGAPATEVRAVPHVERLPACETPAVLANIQKEFAYREARFWNSSLRVVGYEDVRHVALNPWGPAYIPRRYCTATAHVNDGLRVTERRVNYVILEDMGFAGYGYNVHWCVTGIDRHFHAAPNCRLMLP